MWEYKKICGTFVVVAAWWPNFIADIHWHNFTTALCSVYCARHVICPALALVCTPCHLPCPCWCAYLQCDSPHTHYREPHTESAWSIGGSLCQHQQLSVCTRSPGNCGRESSPVSCNIFSPLSVKWNRLWVQPIMGAGSGGGQGGHRQVG